LGHPRRTGKSLGRKKNMRQPRGKKWRKDIRNKKKKVQGQAGAMKKNAGSSLPPKRDRAPTIGKD